MSLRDEYEATRNRAQSIVDTAKAAGRDLSSAERAAFSDAIDTAKELKARVLRAEADEAQLKTLSTMGGPQYTPTAGKTSDAEFKALHTGIREGRSMTVEVKTLTTDISPTALPNVAAGYIPADLPNDVFFVPSLFPVISAAGPTERILKIANAATSPASGVNEGDVKPLSGLTTSYQDIEILKFAVRDKYSREALEDYGWFVQILGTELPRAVRSAINAHAVGVLSASGAGLTAASGHNLIDSVALAKATLMSSYATVPDAILVNPLDLATAEQAKASGSGEYVLDVLSAAPQAIHGVRVVASPAVASGTVYIGNFQTAGRFLQRGGMTFLTGFDGDDFSRNMTSIVAEQRCAVGLVRPSHIVKATLA